MELAEIFNKYTLDNLSKKIAKFKDTELISEDVKEQINKILSQKKEIDKKLELLEKDLIPLKVAIVGEFSSGKSSIINSLLGENIIPTGDEPMTSVVSIFKYGNGKYIEAEYEGRIITLTQEEFSLIKHISKEEAKVKLGIDTEKINKLIFYYPNDLLTKINIIDTPGFSTANHKGDDEKTLKVIENEIDVLFWTIDVNQGTINETSLKILKNIQNKRKDLPIFIIANKIETKGKPSSAKIKTILEDISEKSGISDVYPYSAKMILESLNEDNYIDKVVKKIKELIESNNFPILLDKEVKKRLKKELQQIKIIFDQKEEIISINDFSEWENLRVNLINKLEEIREHSKGYIAFSIQNKVNELVNSYQKLLEDINKQLKMTLDKINNVEKTLNRTVKRFLKDLIPLKLANFEDTIEKQLYEHFLFKDEEDIEDIKELFEIFFEEDLITEINNILNNFDKLIDSIINKLQFRNLKSLKDFREESRKMLLYEIEESFKLFVELSSKFISYKSYLFENSREVDKAVNEEYFLHVYLKKILVGYISSQVEMVDMILEQKEKEIKSLKALVEG
ncbi:dynamin family protein [Hydrogenivirga sp. 128-5-R1-1]|uniref:dynamin family protein n=1 Tax=Hydrogenivirga sp. 128-5-R1-1 TaxID=392423 RepID=UPI00015F1F90|nr:dynamin family protein [Hydrogenivirga sp. 128-5-R1-1]EDP73834.1 putative atp /gtp binding protein [Hydrogenivirga sp. 128-5-R1-1]